MKRAMFLAIAAMGLAFAEDSFGFQLDAGSAECVSCHALPAEGAYSPLSGCGHPVGVDYARASAENPGLAPEPLDKAVRLFEGGVGCVTCHAPYAAGHEQDSRARAAGGPDPMLVIDNRGSALCVSCHRK